MPSKNTKSKNTKSKNTKRNADPDRVPLTEVMPKKGKGRQSKSAARAEGAARTKATKAARPAAAPKPQRASGLNLAAQVLVEAKEPLAAKAIAERAIAAGWKTSGRTPHATLYAAIIREIRDKGAGSRFQKTDRGLFQAA